MQVPKHWRTSKGVLWFNSQGRQKEVVTNDHVLPGPLQPLQKPRVREQFCPCFRFFPWHKMKGKNSHWRTWKHPSEWQVSWSYQFQMDWHAIHEDTCEDFFFYTLCSFEMFPLQRGSKIFKMSDYLNSKEKRLLHYVICSNPRAISLSPELLSFSQACLVTSKSKKIYRIKGEV